MERARHYQRNDPVVGQAVRRLVANIVQDGFTLDVNTDDKVWNQERKAQWYEWAENADLCHSEGELTFQQMEQLALSTVIVDGDTIPLPLKSGSLQWVEAHRCRTPKNTTKNVVHGVELDDNAKRVAYWLTKEDLDPHRPLIKTSDAIRYPTRDPKTGERQVFHLYQPYRFSQRRGVTALAPISDTVGMNDDIQFAAMVKQQMGALIAILHSRGPGWVPGGDQQKGDRENETLAGGHTRTIEGVSAGLEVFSDVDEKLEGFSPNIPGPGFFEHSNLILTFIAINLDIPVHVLLLDPSKTNFSGWRGAIDQARLRFRQIQQWLTHAFHCRVYRWKLRQWASKDRSIAERLNADPAKWMSHVWNPPTFPYIEPLTDTKTDLLRLRTGMISPRRLQAERGRDDEEITEESVQDMGRKIRRAKKEAMAINKEFDDGHPVVWREVLMLPTPEGTNVSLQPPPEPKEEAQTDA
jgi:lambda family phage portal protein